VGSGAAAARERQRLRGRFAHRPRREATTQAVEHRRTLAPRHPTEAVALRVAEEIRSVLARDFPEGWIVHRVLKTQQAAGFFQPAK
jgi:hypothetical protein